MLPIPCPHGPFPLSPQNLTAHLATVGGVQPEKHLHGGYQLHLSLQPQARLHQDEEGRGSEHGDIGCGVVQGQRPHGGQAQTR